MQKKRKYSLKVELLYKFNDIHYILSLTIGKIGQLI